MRNLMTLILVLLSSHVYSGEIEVRLPLSIVNNSLNALAGAQVFTVVDPEGVPYREQTKRLRITSVRVSPGSNANQLRWDLQGVFSVRYGVAVSGAVSLTGTSTVVAQTGENGINVNSCFDVDNFNISSTDPAVQGVLYLVQPMLKTAAIGLGKLRMCAQFASPAEKYFPFWQQLQVKSVATSVNSTDQTVGVKFLTEDSAPLRNTMVSPGVNLLLLRE